MARRLEAADLRAVCDPASLPFRSTADLPPLDGMIGQDRALSATTFGIAMKHRGYNLFVLGPTATGKSTTIRRLLRRAAETEPVPADYCYVHNFVDASRPTALEVPAGRGRELRDEMARLVEECRTRLPRAFYAEQGQRPLVSREDVAQAIAQKIYRASLIEERVSRLIAEGTLFIGTDGEAVGQVNGISVIATGDHAFGRPSRITVRTFSGQPGVIDIEREAKLGGPVHSKGVMILTGFLAGRYARQRPLALSASIAFEQQYEEIEGDSASSAELYALLSSLSGMPLTQAIAVTGSVNQQGEIQPVGGVNEKIEGFFDVCQARGLTGRQGVMIPEANVRNLMLRPDVVEAVRAGRFHVYAVSRVDEGLELLTGRPAGERGADGTFPQDSVNAAVESTLAQNVDRLRQMRVDGASPVTAGASR